MSDGAICLGVFALLSAITASPGAYRAARYYYRMRYLIRKAERCVQAEDWAEAHRLMARALCGEDGVNDSQSRRVYRYRMENKLVQVAIKLQRFDDALERIETMDMRYKAASSVHARANSQYLRMLVAEAMGDIEGARRFRLTALSLMKEMGDSPHRAYLQQSVDSERSREVYQLIKDHRPTQAANAAGNLLWEPDFTGPNRGYVHSLAGYAKQTLGDLEASCRHYQTALESCRDTQYAAYRDSLIGCLALNATLAADREETRRLLALVSGIPDSALARCNFLLNRNAVDLNWEVDSAADRTIREAFAEIDGLLNAAEDCAEKQEILLRFELQRLYYFANVLPPEQGLKDARQVYASLESNAEAVESYPIYMAAVELLLDIREGNRDGYLRRLNAVAASILHFLSRRSPTDEVMLRRDYGVLVEACLAVSDFDAAEQYVERIAGLPVIPITLPQIACWRGRIRLGRGDREAARAAFRAAIAFYLPTDAAREAKEYLALASPEPDCRETDR